MKKSRACCTGGLYHPAGGLYHPVCQSSWQLAGQRNRIYLMHKAISAFVLNSVLAPKISDGISPLGHGNQEQRNPAHAPRPTGRVWPGHDTWLTDHPTPSSCSLTSLPCTLAGPASFSRGASPPRHLPLTIPGTAQLGRGQRRYCRVRAELLHSSPWAARNG